MRTEVDTFVWSSINLKRLNVDIQCGHLKLSISMLDSLTEVTPSRYAFQGMRTPALMLLTSLDTKRTGFNMYALRKVYAAAINFP